MKRFLFLTLYLCMSALTLWAQSFKADITDVNGYYRLTFTVSSTNASNFTPPSLSDFEILSGPSVSTYNSIQIINGKTTKSESTTYTYILSSKKSGKVSIGSASVRVGNKNLRSTPLTYQAKAGSQPNRSHSSSHSSSAEHNEVQQIGSRITQRDLFIDVTPSRTRIHEQEAVLLTYKIHSRIGVGLANTSLTNKPDFKGLISQEIPLPGNQIQTTLEQRGGTTYRTGTILQYLVFPQHSGEITIPSITFNCTVVQQNHNIDLAEAFFNGGGSIGVTVERSVPVTTLHVNELPQPKPANFSGAVGEFTIQGKVLNPSIRTNDVATYRITLDGLGNLKLITPPNVKFPSDFETYDAKTNESSKVTEKGLTGKLTFDYTFVPRNVGKYEIPSIEFVYFDTETSTYQTIRTQPISLNVLQGERSNDDVDHQLALLRSDIRDIHNASNLQGLPSFLSWSNWQYSVSITILIALFIVSMVLLKRYVQAHSNLTERRKSKAGKEALNRLEQAKSLQSQPDSAIFYAAVNKALIGYIADTFNIGQAEINESKITQLLTEKGVAPEAVALWNQVMQTCEYARYAPGAESQKEETLAKAIQALEAVQK